MNKKVDDSLEKKVNSLESDVVALKKALNHFQKHITKLTTGYKRLADQNIALKSELHNSRAATKELQLQLRHMGR